jgi:hypothetical protein
MNNITYVVKKQLTLNYYYIQCQGSIDSTEQRTYGGRHHRRNESVTVTNHYKYVFPEVNSQLCDEFIGNIHKATLTLIQSYKAFVKSEIGTTLWFHTKEDAEQAIEFLESLKVIEKLAPSC